MLDRVGWSSSEIRERCQDGTIRELRAYLAAGLVLVPTNPEAPPIKMGDVVREVCLKHNIHEKHLKGRSRSSGLVLARQEVAVRCHVDLHQSVTDISRVLNRDHSTIVYLLARAGVRGSPHLKEVCRKGHALTTDNVKLSPLGHRKCKVCLRAAWARRRHREKMTRQQPYF